MTDRFRWHDAARLFDGSGALVLPAAATLPILPDTAQGLAQAIGMQAFRLGAPDQPPPDVGPVPSLETLTSGSTGRPRRILRGQSSWIASFVVNARFGIGPGAKVAVVGRLVHSLSLYGAVEGLHLGAEVHLLDLLRPDRQAQAIIDRAISHLYATPAQLRLLVESGVSCPSLSVILVGGSKLDASLLAALRHLAPHARIHEFYGAAEASFISIADADTPAESVGRPYPGVQVNVDPSGEIWVKSPYVFMGYAGEAGSARWRDGWLSVGEIGRMDAGFLYLQGRAGRVVKVADQNVFPEEIEVLMQAMPGIRRAAVLPVSDALRGSVLVAAVQGDPACEPAVLAALRSQLGATKAPKALIWITDWPILSSGKADLQALARHVAWPG